MEVPRGLGAAQSSATAVVSGWFGRGCDRSGRGGVLDAAAARGCTCAELAASPITRTRVTGASGSRYRHARGHAGYSRGAGRA